MAKITIYIGLQKDTTRLYLRDSEGNSGAPKGFVTHVAPGDAIVWQLEAGAGIDALLEIAPKRERFTLFENGEPQALENGSWSGKIRQDAEGTDSYNITYMIKDQHYTEDPDVSTKPPGP